MAKSWCTAPSDPVVRQIAEKYNLDKKDAMRIFNNAKTNDPLCRDPKATLEFLEQQQGFKDALDVYTKDYIEAENAFFQNPERQKQVKDTKAEIKKHLGVDLSAEELNDLMDRYSDLNTEVRLSKVASKKLTAVMSAFKDMRRLNFLGNWIAWKVMTTMNSIENYVEFRKDYNIAAQNRRIDYFKDTNVINAIFEETKGELEDALADCEDKKKTQQASELRAVLENFETVLYMYGGKIFRDEGVYISPEGVFQVDDSTDTTLEQNDNDSDGNGINDSTDGENPSTDYDISENDKSVTAGMSSRVKHFIADIHNGPDAYGYGLHKPLNVSYAINQMLALCKGCMSYADMVERLSQGASRIGWLKVILRNLSDDPNSLPASKKETMKTLFFLALRKTFLNKRTTYWWSKRDGTTGLGNRITNSSHSFDKLYKGLNGKLNRMAGADMFDKGKVSTARMEAIWSELLSLKEKMNTLNLSASTIAEQKRKGNNAVTMRDLTKDLRGYITQMRDILKRIGLDVDWGVINGCLSQEPQNRTLYQGRGWNEADVFSKEFLNANRLLGHITDLAGSFLQWSRISQEETKKTGDSPKVNPLIWRRRYEFETETPVSYKLQAQLQNLLSYLTAAGTDSVEASYWANGKKRYSWNNPVTADDLMTRLTDRNELRRCRFINRKYGSDDLWFSKGGGEFYSHWLTEMYNGVDPIFPPQYFEKDSFNNKEYYKMCDADTMLSMLSDYFIKDSADRGAQRYANYRMLIASDKPRYATIRNKKVGHKEFVSQMIDFFAQELLRSIDVVRYAAYQPDGIKVDNYDIDYHDKRYKPVIDKVIRGEHVTVNDVLQDGRYIFRNTGASFFLNKFLNKEIENKTKLGEYVVDRIFNANRHTEEKIVDDSIIQDFKDALERESLNMVDDFFSEMYKNGLLDQLDYKDGANEETAAVTKFLDSLTSYENMNSIAYNSETVGNRSIDNLKKEVIDFLKENDPTFDEKGKDAYINKLATLKLYLYAFIQDNWYAKANMMEIFNVDAAFYGNTTNFQKRNAQTVATGIAPDVDATIHGDKVCDGKYRSITIVTPQKVVSRSLSNLTILINKQAEKISDPNRRMAFQRDTANTLEALKNIDPTDGQAWTTLTGLRKRLVGYGEWTRSENKEDDKVGYVMRNGRKTYIMTDEAVYQRMRRGEPIDEDWTHIFTAGPRKPFVSGAADVRRIGRGFTGELTYSTQYKNSEYALCFLLAYTSPVDKLGSQLEAIAKIVEESADDDPTKGIDSINFDSAQKVGVNSGAIDITGLSPQETYKKLHDAIYGEKEIKGPDGKRIYQNGVVTEYDAQDYRIVQQKPAHFRDASQQIGSQAKIVTISNLNDSAECTMPDGTKLSGKELKRRYMDAQKRKSEKTIRECRKELGLDLPMSARTHKLSRMLMKSMSGDQRFTSDMRQALSVIVRDGTDQFRIPLDEVAQQHDVEAMLLSKIRKIFYNQKTRGGIVVQATSYQKADDLDIRFYSSNPEDAKYGGVVPTFKQYQADHRGATEQQYEDYLKQYQQGYAWFECEVPMPSYVRDLLDERTGGKYKEKGFIKNDGSWDMEKIKEVVPEMNLDAICYRIPTEAKYSMMRCKVVRFSPEGGGDVARYPLELTVLTGSDFDIDVDYIELRPDPGTDPDGIDTEIFDLQTAALTADSSIQETFHQGDFTDLKSLSYWTTLRRNGYTAEQLSKMSPKEIKSKCMEIEDLDLMNPVTDVLLHNQNSDAKDMVGIAAVQNTSHSFMSIYNTVDESNPQRDPRLHPENFLRIKLGGSKGGAGIVAINDKNPNSPVRMDLNGFVFFDMVYDMDGNLESLEIGKYIGASTDAAKDAAEYRLNINRFTLPLITTMHRMGISADVARLLISQPIVRGLVEQARSEGRTSLSVDYIEHAIRVINGEDQNTESDEEKEGIIAKLNKSGDKVLRYSDLVDGLDKDIYDPEMLSRNSEYLYILRQVLATQGVMRQVDAFTRYNSSKTMGGATFIDRYIARRNISKLSDALNAENPNVLLPQDIEMSEEYTKDELGKLCSMFPQIAATLSGESELVSEAITDHMRTYGMPFFSFADRLLNALDNRNTQLSADAQAAVVRTMYDAWKHFLLFYGDRAIVNFNNRNMLLKYTAEFANYYNEKMKELNNNDEIRTKVFEDNAFIKSLYVDNPVVKANQRIPAISLVKSITFGLSGDELEKYKSDWAALLNYPETRQLAIDLAIHFLAQKTGFSSDTSATLMPITIKEAIPNYVEALAYADRQVIDDYVANDFLAMVQLNNTAGDNSKWFQQYVGQKYASVMPDKEGNLWLRANEETLRRLIDKETGKAILPVVKVQTDTKEYGYFMIDPDYVLDKTTPDDNTKFSHKIKVIEVSPLGVRGRLQEYSRESMYTGTAFPEIENVSTTEGEQVEVAADSADLDELSPEEKFAESLPEGITTGQETGSFVETSPYGDETFDESYDKMLARDTSNEDNAYLESRTYLKRLNRAAQVFGLNATTSRVGRNIGGGQRSYAYSISVTPNTSSEDMHKQALQFAAVASEIGMSDGDPTVKTYTTDMEEANAVEFTIKFNEGNETSIESALRRTLKGKGMDYTVNKDKSEISITLNIPEGSVADNVNPIRQKLATINAARNQLIQEGLTDREVEAEANFLIMDTLSKNDRQQIINGILNGQETDEQAVVDQTRTDVAKYGRHQTWDKEGVRDLAKLAQRRISGEEIESDLRQAFGEWHKPISTRSLQGRRLVDDVLVNLDSNIIESILGVTSGMTRSYEGSKRLVENVIVNVANWIEGNRSQDSIIASLEKNGVKKETSEAILSEIDKQLDKNNVC